MKIRMIAVVTVLLARSAVCVMTSDGDSAAAPVIEVTDGLGNAP